MFTPMFLDITGKILFLNDFKKAFLNFERTLKGTFARMLHVSHCAFLEVLNMYLFLCFIYIHAFIQSFLPTIQVFLCPGGSNP